LKSHLHQKKKELIKQHEDTLNLLNNTENIQEYSQMEDIAESEENKIEIPQVANEGEETRERCCKRFGGICGKIKRFGRAIGIFLFMLFPWLYFMTTPYGFPWFIFPNGLILLIAAIKKIKRKYNNVEDQEGKSLKFLSIHAAFYIIINSLIIITNIYTNGYPFSLLILDISTLIIALHYLRTKGKNTKYNDSFFKHFLIYIFVGAFLFLIYSYSGCYNNIYNDLYQQYHQYIDNKRILVKEYTRIPTMYCGNNIFLGLFIYFIPMGIWSVILFIHFLLFKKKKISGFVELKYQEKMKNIEKKSLLLFKKKILKEKMIILLQMI